MNKIYYTKGYKYRVKVQLEVELVDCPHIPFVSSSGQGSRLSKPFAYIKKWRLNGYSNYRYFLVIEPGYAWDGATWALDTKNFRRPSCCHDVLLELIGLGLLPADPWKKWTDNFLIKLCKEDSMWWPRRKWVYRAVRALGDPQGSKPRKVYSAP